MFTLRRKTKNPLDHANPQPETPKKRVKIVRWVAGSVAALLLVTVGAQLLYPKDKTLPYATINGKAAGAQSLAEVTPLLQDVFEDATVKLTAGTAGTDTTLGALGATLATEKTAAPLFEYSLLQRLIPFSALWQRPTLKGLYVTFDDQQLSKAAAELALKMASQPKNGDIDLNEKGDIVVVDALDGATVKPESIVSAVKIGQFGFGASKVTVKPDIIKPAITNDMVASVKTKILAAVDRPLVLKNSLDEKASYTPDKPTKASWIMIGDDLKLLSGSPYNQHTV